MQFVLVYFAIVKNRYLVGSIVVKTIEINNIDIHHDLIVFSINLFMVWAHTKLGLTMHQYRHITYFCYWIIFQLINVVVN